MGTTVWPVDAVSGAPNYTGRMGRQTAGALVGGKTAARPLGGRSGLIAGSGNPVSASSTTWTVGECVGVIDGEASTAAGPYFFSNDSNVAGSMTAADGSNGRIDIISAQVSDPAEGDGSSVPSVAFVYTTGVASGTPVAPATPARAVLIAQISVPRSGTGSPSIIDTATPRVVAAGGIIPCSSSAVYPASPYVGQIIDDATLGPLRWNGTAWRRYGLGTDPAWTTQTVGGSYTNVGPPVLAWRRDGVWVHWRGLIAPNTGSFAANTSIVLIAAAGIAAAAIPAYKINVPVSSSVPTADCRAIINTDGSLTIATGGDPAPYIDMAGVPPYSVDV